MIYEHRTHKLWPFHQCEKHERFALCAAAYAAALFPVQGPVLQDIPLHAFVLVLAASLYNL